MEVLQILKDKPETCAFCKRKEINELKYGPLYKRDGLVAHYYCVLFSYRVIQNGADDEGILGFLVRDIRNELKRVRNIICDYCSKPNASIYCCNSSCDRKFHFPCGILKKSLHQYKGSFKSFCSEHRPRQKIPIEHLAEAEKNTPKCVVCYDDLDYTCETEVLWANCCLKTWYHRDCLQKFALSSGYLFKCAICNNRRQFKQWVEEYGIFVPKQDASWELEPNAFSELLVQHGKCDATDCICPFGREFSSDRHLREWEIILCKTCASQGIHSACCTSTADSNWECDLCQLVRIKLRQKRSRQKLSVRSQSSSSTRPRSYLLSGAADFENVASSSFTGNLISLEAVSSEGRLIRSRTERKRKRKEVQDEKSDVKKTAFEESQNLGHGSQTCFEEATSTGFAHSSNALPNFEYDADTDDEAVEVEDSLTDTSDEDEEVNVDGPEISYVATPSNNDIEESKRRDQGILIIDLTQSAHRVNDEEMITVMETYRSIQLSDIRYRVKKEVYVISDDDDDCKVEKVDTKVDNEDDDDDDDYDNDFESVDNELQIILHKNNSNGSSRSSISISDNDAKSPSLIGMSRTATKSDVSMIVQIEDDAPNEENSDEVEITSFGNNYVKDEDEVEIENEIDVEEVDVNEVDVDVDDDEVNQINEGEEGRQVEVVEISDEAPTPEPKANPSSLLGSENSQVGQSSRASGPSERRTKSNSLDKYFFLIFGKKSSEKRSSRSGRSGSSRRLSSSRRLRRLRRLKKDIRRVIVNRKRRSGRKYKVCFATTDKEGDEDSHVTVSSDSDSEHTWKKEVIDDDDDDDDVQIISSTSG